MNEKHAPCSGGACAAIVSFIDWNAVAAQAPPLHFVDKYWFIGETEPLRRYAPPSTGLPAPVCIEGGPVPLQTGVSPTNQNLHKTEQIHPSQVYALL